MVDRRLMWDAGNSSEMTPYAKGVNNYIKFATKQPDELSKRAITQVPLHSNGEPSRPT